MPAFTSMASRQSMPASTMPGSSGSMKPQECMMTFRPRPWQ